MNTFGEHWTFTGFGESHGPAIGGVLDGVPAGIPIDLDIIREALVARQGGALPGVSTRALREQDEVEWLSGVMSVSKRSERSVSETVCQQNGLSGEAGLITLGTPIAFIIRNKDARPEDYAWLRHSYRPGHADWVYEQKYGIRDWRGGGRASARETAARVVAGSIAEQELARHGVTIAAQLIQIGEEKNPQRFEALLSEVQQAGDSIGGVVECVVTGLPVGIGDPVFDKLQSHLAAAVMSINACKGFAYGTGFEGVGLRGSELYHPGEVPCPASGGIEGGISNGLPIVFRCVFKPTATISRLYKGRHDVCVAVRAVPVVKAMTALTLIQFITPSIHLFGDVTGT